MGLHSEYRSQARPDKELACEDCQVKLVLIRISLNEESLTIERLIQIYSHQQNVSFHWTWLKPPVPVVAAFERLSLVGAG